MFPPCDALLSDGSDVHLREIDPRRDAAALQELYDGLSTTSVYRRWFNCNRSITYSDVKRILGGGNHVHLLAERHGHLVGIAGWEVLVDPRTAEVAFVVADDHQGAGVGMLLLEHLAGQALSAGIATFVAQALAENGPMLGVFRDAGFVVTSRTCQGVVELTFPIADTARTLAAADRREAASQVLSLQPLLAPRSTLRVGDVADLTSLSTPLDLVVCDLPAPSVLAVASAATARGARALVVETVLAADVRRELLELCRAHDVRLVGPRSEGVHRGHGHAGLLVQAASGVRKQAQARGLEISSFVSVGDKADVSGNDLLSWWECDGDTHICGLVLESLGNPRKFARIAARVARVKPIVAVAGSDPVVDAVLRQAGVIRAGNVAELLDVLLMATGPPPPGQSLSVEEQQASERLATAAARRSDGPGDAPHLTPEAGAAVRDIVNAQLRQDPQGGWLTEHGARTLIKAIGIAAEVSAGIHPDARFGSLVFLGDGAVRELGLPPLSAAAASTLAHGDGPVASVLIALSGLAVRAPEIVELTLSPLRVRVAAPGGTTGQRRRLR